MKNPQNIDENLKSICLTVIKYFDKLKNEGKISQEDYEKHTKLKKEFLEKINGK